jgi:6-phosphofructokinase
VPKTIDNDVGDSEFKLIDHTPGYGSTARYWAHAVQFANEENAGSSPADPVLVLQAMGRKIGFIPAAARLADPERALPLQIYLAERPVTLEQIADNVSGLLRRAGRAILVVSEGLSIADLGARKDAFGHTQFSSSDLTVAQALINALNAKGLPVKGAARANVPGTDQRHNMIYASTVDLEEAYRAGQKAAELAASATGGFMATVLREPGLHYNVRYDKVPLAEVANSERTFPSDWISADGTDVSDEFLRYARPLIGDDWPSLPLVDGRLRLARLQPLFAGQKLPTYVPQADRK